MPSIVFEPHGYSGRYIVFDPPAAEPYKLAALIAVLFAAVLVGILAASVSRC